MPFDSLALDRGSVRTIDQDGHLHIALNPISKANICPYMGSEIPDAEALGLKPQQIYQLYRDPEELAKSASTFNGKPLLIVHKPQSSDDHSRELTVGSVNNPVFDAPYLKAELVVWDGEAIAGIESGDQRQLSCGYRYKAVMTPGEVSGVRFDGRMVDIVGNHVAIVTIGRAGSDVVVGDSAIQLVPNREDSDMTEQLTLNRSARVASIALDAFLRPKLIKGANIDLSKIVHGMTGKEWKGNKPKIKLALDAAVTGKLAKDADIADVIEMLDRLDDVVDEEEDVTPRGAGADTTGPLSQDEEAMYQSLSARRTPAEDEKDDDDKDEKDDDKDDDDDDDEEKKKKNPFAGKDKKSAKDKSAKDKSAKDKKAMDSEQMISKAAMDAALAVMAQTTEAATITRLNAIREAEQSVEPYIGKIAIPQKSAEDVYRLALDMMKVETKGLHPDALRPILMAQPKPGDEVRAHRPRMAADSAGADAKYLEMFPNANRLSGGR